MKLISGMHRTGTSLIAQICWRAGGDLGNPDEFYRPDRWNPDGYFEQPDIHAINMPLVSGRGWGVTLLRVMGNLRVPSPETVLKRSRRLEQAIREAAAKYDNRIIKDVRFSITLPVWLQYGARIDRILVCLRDPIQVAHSLRSRNHLPLSHGLRLWRQHYERLFEAADGIPLCYVYYNKLFDRDGFMSEMGRALRFLGLEAGRERLDDLRNQCVKHNLKHSAQTVYPYPPAVARLWDDLLRRHASQPEGDAR